MNAYLNRMFESARTMALEAQLHLGADNAAAKKILDGLSAYNPDADEDFAARGELYQNLRYGLADALYNEMYAAELTDAQRKDFKIAYDDFQGAAKFIDKDPYAEMAGDFNDAREQSFISKLAGMIHGVDSLWEPK